MVASYQYKGKYYCAECGRQFRKPQEYKWRVFCIDKGGPVYEPICRSEWHGVYPE